MLRYIRITLIILFVAAFLGAGALWLYQYTHEDTSPPAFRSDTDLLEVSVTDPSEALVEGLYAYDNMDGDLSGQIRVRDISTLINETDVKVSYIVFDEASNYATYSRTVRYKDYSSPRFKLLRPMVFNMGDTVNFRGSVTVTDQRDGDISGRLRLEESNVLNSTPGTYTARLSATNRMGDTIYLPLTIQIVDKSASRPVIELTEYLVYLQQGETVKFRRYLASVKDPLLSGEEEIPLSKVSINQSGVDMDSPGVYEVYYYYTGESGELATAILTVVVE